jgi:pyridoxine 5'-phosphate synthase PdxJ
MIFESPAFVEKITVNRRDDKRHNRNPNDFLPFRYMENARENIENSEINNRIHDADHHEPSKLRY